MQAETSFTSALPPIQTRPMGKILHFIYLLYKTHYKKKLNLHAPECAADPDSEATTGWGGGGSETEAGAGGTYTEQREADHHTVLNDRRFLSTH